MATPQPINVSVSQQYDNSRPYQPRARNSTRNAKVDRRHKRSSPLPPQLRAVVEVSRVAGRVIDKKKKSSKKTDLLAKDWDEDFDELEDITDEYSAANTGKKDGLLRNTVHIALEVRARMRAFRAVRVVAMYAGYAALFLLFLGLINLIAAGVAVAVEAASNSVKDGVITSISYTPLGILIKYTNQATGGVLGDAAAAAADTAVETIETVSGINVVDLFDVNRPPIMLFGLTNYAMFFIGNFFMFLTAFIFFVCGVKPLGGKHSTPKMISFSLGVTCYAFPILNLVPWFVVYAAVVFYNPR